MVFLDCQGGSLSLSGSAQIQTNPANVNLTTSPFGPAVNTTLVGRMSQDGNAQALAGFSAVLWLVSGTGASAINEVALCQFSDAGGARSTTGTWQRAQPLPNAGRPWSPATDAARLIATGPTTASSPTNTVHLAFSVCDETGTVPSDCCAELNGKLDLIISYVAAQLHNQP